MLKKKRKRKRKPTNETSVSSKVKTLMMSTTTKRPHSITTARRAPPHKIHHVLVTGASGFVGKAVVRELLQQGYFVHAFVRKGNDQKIGRHERLTLKYGDILDYPSVLAAMEGIHAVIHLVGIIEETKETTFEKMHILGTQNVVNAAKELGIQRFIQMSALGTRPHAKSMYHQTKYKAEELVRLSGLNFTIFRPSLIFGPGDKSINLFISILKKQPGAAVFPILGKGKVQPVSVEDVAHGLVNSLRIPQSVGLIYNIGGPTKFTMEELIKTIGKTIGKAVLTPKIPYNLTRTMLALGGKIMPINVEQLIMLQEDNTCDHTVYCKVFNVRLREFAPRLKEYIV